MEKLYYETPYVREFEARVLTCEKGKKGFDITLDRTAFYPEGGGQPSDTGTLGGAHVLEVHERDEQILHNTDVSLEPGSTVKGVLNWEQRFMNMQQHSGEHIVSGLIHACFGYDNVGFHMGNDEMTIDLNGTLTWEQLMEVERDANALVYENLAVCTTYPSAEELLRITYRSKKELTGQVRIVEIPGADICACCGTHVARTGEIGIIKFLSMINYKGGVRVSMLCGRKALLCLEQRTDQAAYLSALLSAKPDELLEAVERLLAEAASREARIGGLTRELLALKAAQYEESADPLLVFEQDFKPQQVRQFCNLLMEGGKGSVIAVCASKPEGGYHYCIGSLTEDLQRICRALNERLDGRGGGSSQMVQGTFSAGELEIEAAFEATVSGNGQKGI